MPACPTTAPAPKRKAEPSSCFTTLASSPPRVNIRIAGEEADLVWPRRRLVVEIDGPQYHRFPGEDARKQGVWEAAGYTVRRVTGDRVYGDPAALLAAAKP